MPKLPRDLMSGGLSVAVRGQLGPDAIAHRHTTDKRPNTRRVVGSNQPVQVSVNVPACDPKGEPSPLYSAAWADHKGAVACTEQACFPDA
ncbi:hypothetical protein Ait01nite_030410 [Actinoplanes italicus]|uniref:Uncharacterized protein n=1 Tax=Actinoplanes italicus TaxID=113567 RepID=A0A2T0KIZ4_9ACTN|nr:hypothetical protein [Actinoplanes italicus]PRX23500.1 hypothetical protein CLV67_103248 [Actinoplanes italicus]GIE29996.1 hypothetical protein Ait01nite_030410 [Actinoplanes italicus]